MEKSKYRPYMIVYDKDKKRRNNFEKNNQLFKNNITHFEAIDTINNYHQWKTYSLTNNYCNLKYISEEIENNKLGFLKGKLGCNLSHQLLLENIANLDDNNNNNWYLVLEDDVDISDNYTFSEINEFLETLISKIPSKCNYVQLCVYPQFKSNQSSTLVLNKFILSNGKKYNINKKLPQYGTCAYLITKMAAKYLTMYRPWDKNIDFLYNSLDQQFNSTAIINPYFMCGGSIDAQDNNTKFSSLIWDNS